MGLTLFSYQQGNGILYKIPSFIKILFLIPLTILFFNIEISIAFIVSILITLLSFFLGIKIKTFFHNIKPLFFFVILLFISNTFSHLFSSTLSLKVLIPTEKDIKILLQMFLTLQITSIFFTTTTSIQIKEGLEDIEIFTRKILKKLPFLKKRISADPNISESVSILITFIPKLFVLWQQIDNAWKNRTKKFNIKKISTLLVTFISLCFVQADKT